MPIDPNATSRFTIGISSNRRVLSDSERRLRPKIGRQPRHDLHRDRSQCSLPDQIVESGAGQTQISTVGIVGRTMPAG